VYGIRAWDQAAYKAQEAQIFKDATQTTEFGETASLTYREVGRECNWIPWNGVVEMTLQNVTLYSSYTDALAAGESVSDPNGQLYDESCPFLVVEVEVANVDADEGGFSWDTSVQGVAGDGAVTLHNTGFNLYSETGLNERGCYMAPSTWCADGVSSSELAVEVDVAQGQTLHITLGFMLDRGAEERLDGASLIYDSRYDLMSIGTPAVGGEVEH
jgi:hypothetical protein